MVSHVISYRCHYPRQGFTRTHISSHISMPTYKTWSYSHTYIDAMVLLAHHISESYAMTYVS
ncbi:Ras guanine nucleotide exchange factor efc25 [Gossypium arboreum]|uniref:Ras guanine nucleotide exchange factor efc25 n=1 Tax=Gossypium arboreum TaxID=29729 RepID=A0A0B0P010_GOSAR|nr:Ras guanine nucleotide exchange factor efc25 [Gossypium arboreum]